MSLQKILEIINGLPNLVPYIAPGFALAGSFLWEIEKKLSSGLTLVVVSLVLSFFITSFNDLIGISKTSISAFVLVIIWSIIGLVLGRIYLSKGFNDLLSKLSITRTTHESIFEDVAEKNTWVAIYDEKQDVYYCGKYYYSGGAQSQPNVVVISYYYVFDKSKNSIIEDHTSEKKRYLLFDISNYSQVIFAPTDPFNKFSNN